MSKLNLNNQQEKVYKQRSAKKLRRRYVTSLKTKEKIKIREKNSSRDECIVIIKKWFLAFTWSKKEPFYLIKSSTLIFCWKIHEMKSEKLTDWMMEVITDLSWWVKVSIL